MQGLDTDWVRRLLSYEGHARIKLRLPGMRSPLPLVRAELRWGLGEKNRFQTGWLFNQLDAHTLELIGKYITDHPQDPLADPV